MSRNILFYAVGSFEPKPMRVYNIIYRRSTRVLLVHFRSLLYQPFNRFTQDVCYYIYIAAPVNDSPSDLNSQEILVHDVGIDFFPFFFVFVSTYLVTVGAESAAMRASRKTRKITSSTISIIFYIYIYIYLPVASNTTLLWMDKVYTVVHVLTRITSFQENRWCHGLKCVTEGRPTNIGGNTRAFLPYNTPSGR